VSVSNYTGLTSVLYNNLLISVQKHDVTRLHIDACRWKKSHVNALC